MAGARESIVSQCLVLLLLAANIAFARAEDSALKYGCDRPLRVGIVEFGPMYFAEEGVDVDIIHEMSRRSGCQFEIASMLRIDLWPAIEAGDIDLATNSISTPQRTKLARFVTYFGFKNMMVVPSGRADAINSLPALTAEPDWRLGLVRGFRYGNYDDYHLKQLLGEARILEFPTHAELFDALRIGEVQAVLTPSVNYYFFLNEGERQHFVLVDASPAPPTPSGLALSRKKFSAPQVDNWLRLIESMRLDRTLHRYVERHISKSAAAGMIEY
ncbi:substrate-binding periplasmic protein [Dongia sp.]|uniref:substrate-binding periplasmic protein n=1 Tax=Dongia sp. TaxID=1977262 RepID=UPI0035B2660E